jgi:hypothetical protein
LRCPPAVHQIPFGYFKTSPEIIIAGWISGDVLK